jgi:hypothetical protein
MDLSTALARTARELTGQMLSRVKREPDVADYRAAFLPVLAMYLAPDAKTPDPRNAGNAAVTNCQQPGCSKPALFISFGRALCFEHRNTADADTKKAG